jgi:hypothetical protein
LVVAAAARRTTRLDFAESGFRERVVTWLRDARAELAEKPLNFALSTDEQLGRERRRQDELRR